MSTWEEYVCVSPTLSFENRLNINNRVEIVACILQCFPTKLGEIIFLKRMFIFFIFPSFWRQCGLGFATNTVSHDHVQFTLTV